MLKETRCSLRCYFAFASAVTFLAAIEMNYGSNSGLLFALSILYAMFAVLFAYIAAKLGTLITFGTKFIIGVLKANIGVQAAWFIFGSRDGLHLGPIIGTVVAVSFCLYLMKSVTRLVEEGIQDDA